MIFHYHNVQMSYGDRMFEEALDSLREDNKRLQSNLEKQVLTNADLSGIINEMLIYIEKQDNTLQKDYMYFVKLVEKVLERNR